MNCKTKDIKFIDNEEHSVLIESYHLTYVISEISCSSIIFIVDNSCIVC